MASLNLVAPRFSTLGILEGLRYLQEEKNKEAERQLRIAQTNAEIERLRKLNIEANILQQTGLTKAQSEIEKIRNLAFQYKQAGLENQAQAAAVPIKAQAFVNEKAASATRQYNLGNAALIKAKSDVNVDNATIGLRKNQGAAVLTTAEAAKTRAKAAAAYNYAGVTKRKAEAGVVDDKANAYIAAQQARRTYSLAGAGKIGAETAVVDKKANAYIAAQNSRASLNKAKLSTESTYRQNQIKKQKAELVKLELRNRCLNGDDTACASYKRINATKVNRQPKLKIFAPSNKGNISFGSGIPPVTTSYPDTPRVSVFGTPLPPPPVGAPVVIEKADVLDGSVTKDTSPAYFQEFGE